MNIIFAVLHKWGNFLLFYEDFANKFATALADKDNEGKSITHNRSRQTRVQALELDTGGTTESVTL